MPKIKGDRNAPISSASFDGRAKQRFTALDKTKVLVLLSIVGNEYCTGDYLGATINQALAIHEFTTFLVADTVYWHNLKSSNPSNEEMQALKEEALVLGNHYLEAQLPQFLKPLKMSVTDFDSEHGKKTTSEKIAVINKLAKAHSLPFEIIRWDDWLAKAPTHFSNKEAKITSLFSTEKVLKDSIASQALVFATRHHQKSKTTSIDLLKFRSEGYLIEETVKIICLGALLKYNFIAYPGDLPKPFAAATTFLVKDQSFSSGNLDLDNLLIRLAKPSHFVNWLQINFKRELPKPAPAPDVKVVEGMQPRMTNYPLAFFPSWPTLEKNEEQTKFTTIDEAVKEMTAAILQSPMTFEAKHDLLTSLIQKILHAPQSGLSLSR